VSVVDSPVAVNPVISLLADSNTCSQKCWMSSVFLFHLFSTITINYMSSIRSQRRHELSNGLHTGMALIILYGLIVLV